VKALEARELLNATLPDFTLTKGKLYATVAGQKQLLDSSVKSFAVVDNTVTDLRTTGATYDYVNGAWQQLSSQGVQGLFTGVDAQGQPATISLFTDGTVDASNPAGVTSLGTDQGLVTGGVVEWLAGLDATGQMVNQALLPNGSTYEYANGTWSQMSSQGVQRLFPGVDAQGRPATITLNTDGSVYASNALGAVSLGTNMALVTGGVTQWFVGQDASGKVVNQAVLKNGSTYEYVGGAWAQMSSKGVRAFFTGVDAQSRPATITLRTNGAVYASNG
jgi:hypothetical protein